MNRELFRRVLQDVKPEVWERATKEARRITEQSYREADEFMARLNEKAPPCTVKAPGWA